MPKIEEQIEKIQKEIRETPYHKGTEHHIGMLRAKLAKLRAKSSERPSTSSGSSRGYAVKKQGDASIVLVGPPSVGKSTLLNKLTNAKSKIAPYEFTTVSVIPGMMNYRDAQIQILDVPGLIEGAEEGKGRGKEVLSVVRSSDLLILVTDIERIKAFKTINETLYDNGIRINREKSDVTIDKKVGGGITIHSNLKQKIDKQTIKELAREFGHSNADITLNEVLDMESLIDAFAGNRVYIPAIYVVNKVDLEENKNKSNKFLYISAENNIKLDNLREEIWEKLGLVRVYLVKTDEEPNKENPIIMRKRDKLSDVAEEIGTEFAEENNRAKIWGPGAKFPGQEVSIDTRVQEGMQVRFI